MTSLTGADCTSLTEALVEQTTSPQFIGWQLDALLGEICPQVSTSELQYWTLLE